jgi:cytochrome b6-f complex iron-sulfur subunit
MSDDKVTRRRFLTRAAGLVAGGAMSSLAGCGAPSAERLLSAPPRQLEVPLAESSALRQVGGSVTTTTGPGGGQILLVRRSLTEVIAVSPICPHQGCTVNYTGEMDAACFVCPCHGSAFGIEGELHRGPAEQGLTRYPTAMSNDKVLITL